MSSAQCSRSSPVFLLASSCEVHQLSVIGPLCFLVVFSSICCLIKPHVTAVCVS